MKTLCTCSFEKIDAPKLGPQPGAKFGNTNGSALRKQLQKTQNQHKTEWEMKNLVQISRDARFMKTERVGQHFMGSIEQN